MCNPRRVQILATCQIAEAWQQEVSRTIALTGRVCGEARVRHGLDSVLGGPALRALESRLASDPAWTRVPEGYRCEVEGGHVVYLTDERALEIVATLEDLVSATGDARRTVEGKVNDEFQVEGEGMYYDDGWGGRTKEVGEKQARDDAQKKLEAQKRARLAQARQDTEASQAAAVEAEAQERAQELLEREAARRTAELNLQARQRLETVGLRCRQSFHRILAQSYQDAILAYARRNHAEGIQCTDDGEGIEIEFTVER